MEDRQCPSCGKLVSATNYSKHVRKVHPDQLGALCPRATRRAAPVPVPDPPQAPVAEPETLDELAGVIGAESVSVSSADEEIRPDVPRPQLPELKFVDSRGSEVEVNFRCTYESTSCRICVDGYGSRNLITATGVRIVVIKKLRCLAHGKFFRALNDVSVRDAKDKGWKLNIDCLQFRRSLYDISFIKGMCEDFLLTGSMIHAARKVALFHEAHTLGETDALVDSESDAEEDPDSAASDADGDEDPTLDRKKLDRHLSAIQRMISPMVIAAVTSTGVPSALFERGIRPEHVEHMSMDFTYKCVAKIRLPKTSSKDTSFVGISANLGTLLSSLKICLATTLCPRGEGASQVRRLIEAANIMDEVKSVSVDHVPSMANSVKAVLGAHVEVFGDRFHTYRLLTHGTKHKDPERVKLFASLRRLSSDIKCGQVQTLHQIRHELQQILEAFSQPRTTTAMHIPRGAKVSAALCSGLVNAASLEEARKELVHHGALEVFPPLLNGELVDRWKKLIADDAALEAMLGQPIALFPQGTNINEAFHSFLNGRLRGYKTCSFELFQLALRVAVEIFNARAIHPDSDSVTFIARSWTKAFVAQPFWDRFLLVERPRTTYQELMTAGQFKVLSSKGWSKQERSDLQDALATIPLETLPPTAVIADIVAAMPAFSSRSATDIGRHIGQILSNKLTGLASAAVGRDERPPTSQKRQRSPSPALPRALRDRVLSAISDLECVHLAPGVVPKVAQDDLVMVTVKQGLARSTGIGLVLQTNAEGHATVVEYYMLDGARCTAGTTNRADVPPEGFTLVNVKRLERRIPLQ